jgi:hypothetical protein
VIHQKDNPFAWTLILSDLQDAREHLGQLIKEMTTEAEYGEPELRIDLGHVYAHLNRAWRRRLKSDDFTDEEWDAAREFPDDLEPIA